MHAPGPPSGGASAIRAFVVADHAALRDSIALLLAAEGIAVTGCAPDPAAALAAAPVPGDVVVCALAAGQREPLARLRTLAAAPGAPPVLVLSADDDDASVARMLAAGAAGFVSNRRAGEALSTAVRAVAAGWSRVPGPPRDDA